MLKNQIKVAVGQPPNLNINYSGYAGIQFLTADQDGVFNGVVGLEEADKLEGVKKVAVTYPIGESIKTPESAYERLGYIYAYGKTYEETQATLKTAIDQLKINVKS